MPLYSITVNNNHCVMAISSEKAYLDKNQGQKMSSNNFRLKNLRTRRFLIYYTPCTSRWKSVIAFKYKHAFWSKKDQFFLLSQGWCPAGHCSRAVFITFYSSETQALLDSDRRVGHELNQTEMLRVEPGALLSGKEQRKTGLYIMKNKFNAFEHQISNA